MLSDTELAEAMEQAVRDALTRVLEMEPPAPGHDPIQADVAEDAVACYSIRDGFDRGDTFEDMLTVVREYAHNLVNRD